MLEKKYESNGHAWPVSVTRCVWALVLFQIFQLSLFTARKQVYSSLLVAPLCMFTIWFGFQLKHVFGPLSVYLNLHDLFFIKDDSEDSVAAQARSQDYLELEPSTDDESDQPTAPDVRGPTQPPLAPNYPGLLESERHVYDQPTLSGNLPDLWLPQTGDNTASA